MKIEALYTYPIKALRAQSLDTATCTKHGFAYERRFMLLEEKTDPSTNAKTYRNMAVAHDPLGTRFFPTLQPPSSPTAKDGSIAVLFSPPKDSSKQESTITIPLEPEVDDLDQVEITMHLSPSKTYIMPSKYNDWFSSCFGYTVVLAYLGPNYRQVLMSTPSSSGTTTGSGWLSSLTSTATSYLPNLSAISPQPPSKEREITFSDCAPYLIVSSASLTPLSSRLPEGTEADITKFRPNIVVSGAAEAWEEDFWAELAVGGSSVSISNRDAEAEADAASHGGVGFTAAHNCARCKSLNIDYDTGAPGKGGGGKLLSVMQRDRRVDPGMKYSPVFGRYCFLTAEEDGDKVVRIGDEVVVSKVNGERTRFGEFAVNPTCFVWDGILLAARQDWSVLGISANIRRSYRLERSCDCLNWQSGKFGLHVQCRYFDVGTKLPLQEVNQLIWQAALLHHKSVTHFCITYDFAALE